MWIIVASLADSICRHPDVTLESGLVPFQLFGTLFKFATVFVLFMQPVFYKIIT